MRKQDDIKVLPFPRRAAMPLNPFNVVSDLPAGAGVDFARHFCTVFQRELAERFSVSQEDDHALR